MVCGRFCANMCRIQLAGAGGLRDRILNRFTAKELCTINTILNLLNDTVYTLYRTEAYYGWFSFEPPDFFQISIRFPCFGLGFFLD